MPTLAKHRPDHLLLLLVVVVLLQMSESLEIVGLHSDANGRSCFMHVICRDHVELADAVRLTPTVIEHQGIEEAAIKCAKVVDGVGTCTVTFVPKTVHDSPQGASPP